MQLEFDFAQVYLQKDKERIEGFNRVLNKLAESFQASKFSISDIFMSCQSLDIDESYNGPSIPMTLLLGSKGQPEFNFVKQIDKQAWGYIGLEIEYNYNAEPNTSV